MRKIFCILFIAVSLVTLAKRPISVNFKEHVENEEIAGILKLLDASQVTAMLHTDSMDATYHEIWMVERSESKIKRTKLGYKQIEPDSTKITFTAVAKDSLNAIISLVHLSAGSPRIDVSIPTANHMLIGCDYEWEFEESDTIPLVGYATGIPIKYNLGDGNIIDAFHICGLRFSKISPSKWKDEYDLPDYLYFEAVPVKEMNFDHIKNPSL